MVFAIDSLREIIEKSVNFSIDIYALRGKRKTTITD
jgi:hypothetical protein